MGYCVHIDEEKRCENRKHNHNIALYVILSLLLIIVFICTYMKKAEKRDNVQRLARLKIEKAQEPDIPRPSTFAKPTHRRLQSQNTHSNPNLLSANN